MRFNVPIASKFYQLEEDFYGFNAGSIFLINYPNERGFTFQVYKKYNKDSPAVKFGQEHHGIERLNKLNATEFNFDESK